MKGSDGMTLLTAIRMLEEELSVDRERYQREVDKRKPTDTHNEQLHYWDGKIKGLVVALGYLRRIVA